MRDKCFVLLGAIVCVLMSCSHVETYQQPLENPQVMQLPNGHFRLLEPWRVRLQDASFTLQKGYTCNGITATDWQKAQMGHGADRKETWCAIFHDWTFTQGMSRQRCDDYFNELMIQYQVAPWKRELMYNIVKMRSAAKLVEQMSNE